MIITIATLTTSDWDRQCYLNILNGKKATDISPSSRPQKRIRFIVTRRIPSETYNPEPIGATNTQLKAMSVNRINVLGARYCSCVDVIQ